MKGRSVFVPVLLAATVGFVACDTGSDPGGSAGVSVYLTDAPIDLAGVHNVDVTLRSIFLYPTNSGSGDAGGIELQSGPISLPEDLTLNLLDFQNGQSTFLGSALVPSGSYYRVRLQIVSAQLGQDDDGDPSTQDLIEPIDVPSGNIDVPVSFQLTQRQELAITLDFNAQASVQVVYSSTGKRSYLLRPVINVVGMQASGS